MLDLPLAMHVTSLLSVAPDVQATVLAGALSKLARDGVLHPLDTLKTRAQIPCASQREAAMKGSLYAGVLPTLLLSLPAGAAYFGFNSAAKEWCGSSVQGVALAGALTATGFWLVRTPSELLKTRAMTESDTSQPFVQGDLRRISSLLRDEGVAALWTGYGATTLRSVPFEVLRLSFYPLLMAALVTVAVEMSWPDGASGAIAGFAASSAAALLTQPLDTIKTSLQLARVSGEASASPPSGLDSDDERSTSQLSRYAGAANAIVQQGGPSALFRGSLYRAANAGLAGGITFGTYQLALPWVERLLAAS